MLVMGHLHNLQYALLICHALTETVYIAHMVFGSLFTWSMYRVQCREDRSSWPSWPCLSALVAASSFNESGVLLSLVSVYIKSPCVVTSKAKSEQRQWNGGGLDDIIKESLMVLVIRCESNSIFWVYNYSTGWVIRVLRIFSVLSSVTEPSNQGQTRRITSMAIARRFQRCVTETNGACYISERYWIPSSTDKASIEL